MRSNTYVLVFRWNSFYDAMNVITDNHDNLNEICVKLKLPIFSNTQEIGFLIEYCKVIINYIFKYFKVIKCSNIKSC